MIDDIYEIYHVIKKNKLRAFLTGFSVAWGVFILILLLGIGNGLKEGVLYNFKDLLKNQYFVRAGSTSLNYAGLPTGRRIELRNEDYKLLIDQYPEIDLKSPISNHNDIISYKLQYNKQTLQGISPSLAIMNNIQLVGKYSRFINQLDISGNRKSVVISSRQKEIFFKKENPIGKYIKIGKSFFQVVGVYKDENQNMHAPMYIPFTTLQSLYNKDIIDSFIFTLKGAEAKEVNIRFINNFRKLMGNKHHFDPNDRSALRIQDTSEDFQILNGIINGITLFIWFIGFSTLLSGIVGVNNIVMISVRERTKEFAIRKTIGAKPFSIIRSVILESTIITMFFGSLGFLLSIIVLKLIGWFLVFYNLQFENTFLSMFSPPTINMQIAVSATLLLIITGMSAGFFPAKKAVMINIIEAMKKI